MTAAILTAQLYHDMITDKSGMITDMQFTLYRRNREFHYPYYLKETRDMSSAKLIMTPTMIMLLILGVTACVNAEPLIVTDNLLVRLETVGTNAVTTDSGGVTSWNDQAALGGLENLTDQGNAAQRPTLLAGVTPSGADALEFDGADDILTHLGLDTDLAGDTYTWFSVFRMSESYAERPTTAQYSHLLANATDAKVIQWGSWVYGGSDYVASLARNADATAASLLFADYANDDVEWHILCGVWNGSAATLNSLAAGSLAGDLDSISMGTDAGGAGTPLSPHAGISVGGNYNWNEYLSGQVAATLIYDTVLDSTDIQAVESYLHDTYLTPVPEPSSLALLCMAGIFGLVGLRQRRR